jgi:hypothetical protein
MVVDFLFKNYLGNLLIFLVGVWFVYIIRNPKNHTDSIGSYVPLMRAVFVILGCFFISIYAFIMNLLDKW